MRWLGGLFLIFTIGCADDPEVIRGGSDAVFLVPGVGGPGGYESLVDAVSFPTRSVMTQPWGAPPALFFLNFSDKGIHDQAEQDFAARVDRWSQAHAGNRIDIIGHSAGCGVVLGALPRMQHARIHNVVLLNPSISPTYDLHPALAKVDGVAYSFFSARDDVMLGWRTGNFGTYDRVQAQAAGNVGFYGDYPRDKLVQYAYDPKWEQLGNRGGHWDSLAGPFARRIVAPLIPP